MESLRTVLATPAAHARSTITTTSSGFGSFLQAAPWTTTLSNAAEVQVILASFPLIVLGFVGIAFAALDLSQTRWNRPRLDLYLSLGAAFLAGILQILNALMCEAQGLSTMITPIRVAESVLLAAFVLFRTCYVFRTCFQLGSRSLLGRESSEKGWGESVTTLVVRRNLIQAMLKWKSVVSLVAIFALDAVWRVGFIHDPTGFRPVYTISQTLEAVLLVFFCAKFFDVARMANPPRRSAYSSVAPSIFGLVILVGIAISNLVPSLSRFSDTPLGRFLALVALYIFLLDSVVQENRSRLQRSYPGLATEKPGRRRVDTDLSFTGLKPEGQGGRRDESSLTLATDELPEGIVVRRSSHIPSWLDRSARTTDSPRRVAAIVPLEINLGQSFPHKSWELDSPIDARMMPSYYRTEVTASHYQSETATIRDEPAEPVEGDIITFRPPSRRLSIVVESESLSPLRPLVLRNSPTKSPTQPTIATGSSRMGRRQDPRTSQYAAMLRASTQVESMEKKVLPVTMPRTGSSEEESFMDPSLLARADTSPSSSKSDRRAPSRQTERTVSENFSLSQFPRPPIEDALTPTRLVNNNTLEQYSPDDSPLSVHGQRSTKIVTEDGLEFELFPPRAPFQQSPEMRYKSGDAGSRYDVTSMFEGGLDSGRSSLLEEEAELRHATIRIPRVLPPPPPRKDDCPVSITSILSTSPLYDPARAFERPRPAPQATVSRGLLSVPTVRLEKNAVGGRNIVVVSRAKA